MNKAQYWSVDAFTGIACKGNAHDVHLLDSDMLDDTQLLAHSKKISPRILVCVLPGWQDEANILKARFFYAGREVQFCGSGCMALAAVIFELQGERDLTVKLPERHKQPEREIKLTKRGGRISLQTNAILNAKRTRAKPWEPIVREEVLDVVTLPTGYVIVELHTETAVKFLNPNLKQLVKQSDMALIVTARAREKNDDYVMRYFAPQYGNPEDAATGSANCFLMKYWQLKLNKKRLVGRQLSAEGGLFYGEIRGNNVVLSANVKLEKIEHDKTFL